jgi:hypothetical protein
MSGVLIEPRDGQLWLPNGELWVPPDSAAGIDLDRIVPRVCLVPDTYAFSSGPEAIDLAAAVGLNLDPWEQLALVLGLAETKLGKWAAFTVALIVARQNGKGSILEALELYWLFVRLERLIGHSAHEYKTAMEGFRRVLWWIENNDWLRKRVKKVINTNGEEGIELITGERLRFMARSKGAGRGFTFHKLVWDEGYALTRSQQDAQLPTMSAVDDPQIWVTSSPPLTSDTGEVLFQLRRMAQALGVQLTFMDYGAAGSLDALERVDLDDHDLWRKTNPSEVHAGSGHGVSIDTMARERSAMSDDGFARERLCIWPPDLTEGFGVITKDQWDAMCDPRSGSDEWPPIGMDLLPGQSAVLEMAAGLAGLRSGHPPTHLMGKPVISIDVSPRVLGQVRSAIGLAMRRADGKRHIEVIARDAGTAWIIPWLRAFLINTPVGGIALDPGSPAGSLLADVANLLVELDKPQELVLRMSAQSVAQAFGMIYDAATEAEPSVVHLGQPELGLAVGGAVTREVGGTGGKAWDRLNGSTDITTLVSVTHALWGLVQPAAMIEEDQPLVVWA